MTKGVRKRNATHWFLQKDCLLPQLWFRNARSRNWELPIADGRLFAKQISILPSKTAHPKSRFCFAKLKSAQGTPRAATTTLAWITCEIDLPTTRNCYNYYDRTLIRVAYWKYLRKNLLVDWSALSCAFLSQCCCVQMRRVARLKRRRSINACRDGRFFSTFYWCVIDQFVMKFCTKVASMFEELCVEFHRNRTD